MSPGPPAGRQDGRPEPALIEATDEYTVVFKLSEQNLNALPMIYNEAHSGGWIYPPEVIEQHGHMQDWKTAVKKDAALAEMCAGNSSHD